jgi:hypothetical protein
MQILTIKSYAYQQYQDDLDIAAFIDAYNTMTQEYVTWCNTVNLPIYTGLSGYMLDWIGAGIYGLPRPVVSVSSGSVYGITDYGAATYGAGSSSSSPVTDDIYKRVLTWKLYRGDGFYFSIKWLKKRIKRFLVGVNGTSPAIDNTSEIYVSVLPTNEIAITINYPADPASVTLFRQCVASGVLDMPWQYSVSTATI